MRLRKYFRTIYLIVVVLEAHFVNTLKGLPSGCAGSPLGRFSDFFLTFHWQSRLYSDREDFLLKAASDHQSGRKFLLFSDN